MLFATPQPLDSTRDYRITLRPPEYGGSLAGAFDGTEVFGATLHRGDGSAADATLSAEWDATEAGNPATLDEPIVRLTVAKAAIEDLSPGLYFVRVVINPGVDDVAILPPDAALELTSGLGSAAALLVYCSLDDMRRECSWIDRVLVSDTSQQADMAEYRASARTWVDSLVLSHASQGLRYGPYSGFGGVVGFSDLEWEAWLRAQLDAGALLVTPQIKRIAALYAVGLALAGVENPDLHKRAGYYFGEAEALASSTWLELDTDGDERVDWRIDLSRTPILRG